MQEHRAVRRASIAAVTIAAVTVTLVAMTAVNGATAEQAGWRPAITVNTLPELPPDEPPDDPPEPTDPAATYPPTTAAPDTSVTPTTVMPTGTGDDSSSGDPSRTSTTTGAPTTTGPATSTTAPTTTATMPQTGGLTVTPSQVDFGPVAIGNSRFVNVTLTNSGTAQAAGLQVRFSGPPSFGLGEHNCGVIHQPNATCTIPITFSPATTGAVSGEATVTVGDATVTLSLSGEGDEPTTSTLPLPRRFRIEPRDVSFGEVPLGSSATQTVTITNNIDQPQSSVIESIHVPTVEGATATWTYTETCTGATLQPDESCTVTFTFTPHTEGSLTFVAGLNVIGPYTGDQGVILRGVGGTLPATTTTTTVLVSPEQALRSDVSAIDFGTGRYSSRVTLTNVGAAALPADFTVQFSGPPSFGLAYNGCTAGLRRNKSCFVDLVFSPVTAGPAAGEARFSMGAARLSVTLAGEGVDPATTTTTSPNSPFGVGPADLSFGEVSVGSGRTRTVMVTNNTEATLSGFILLVDVPTGAATTATWSHYDECTNATLGPGESCLILVSFAPHAEGSVLTNLHVAFNGGISGGREYVVPLRGIGAPSATASTTTTDVTATSTADTTTLPAADSTSPPGDADTGTGGMPPATRAATGDPTTGSAEMGDAAHHVFVVAMFDAADPDGPIAIDRADVQHAPDCEEDE
jgi:Abnormal spindle-like microcephaly-assoc'd, ASPM-SPD-2-Hydin